jgi:fibronectin type 3 domain-containing protein
VTPTATPEAGYLIRRRLATATPETLTVHPAAAPPYLDDKAQPGARYCYTVLNVASTQPLVASAESPEACVDVEDRRPPASPSGVALLPQSGGLEVSWSPSPEPDVLTYRVYRAAAGGELKKLVERTASERAYLDTTTVRGTKYRYVVTAVDRAGNESAQSTPVEGTIP